MTLVDTSVWVNHFRHNEPDLAALLEEAQVIIHPMVMGELACGNLGNRDIVLEMLRGLPRIAEASHEEVLFFIERNRLMGRGIGYVDVHLLAAVSMSGSVRLWTEDRRLRDTGAELGLVY